nr:retrovirus-related Pol polyprotein from transposon TNT 1-94 [Tanacetum cinerariifolium]
MESDIFIGSTSYFYEENESEGTHEKNVQGEQIITNPLKVHLGKNTKVSVSINESSVLDIPQSHISNQASTSFILFFRIELVDIIGDLSKGMLTKSMAAKLTVASASECLFADFLSEIEPKMVSETLKHPRWVNVMQEELN